jgi:hypothetical protein
MTVAQNGIKEGGEEWETKGFETAEAAVVWGLV